MNIQNKKLHDQREFSLFATCKDIAPFRHPEKKSNANAQNITLENFVRYIKTGEDIYGVLPFKNTIEKIRNEPDEARRKKLKMQLPAVSLSVLCNKENRVKDFVSSTCLLQIDIDSKDNEHIFDDPEKKETLRGKLKTDPFIVFVCKSPTNAIKAAIHYGIDESHKAAYETAENYFKHEYGVNIDKACKDINRLMFFTYDPEIYCNYRAVPLQYTTPEKVKSNTAVTFTPDLQASVQLKQLYKYDIDYICEQIETQKIVIVDNYETYLQAAFSLASEYGQHGENYFHIVCRQHEKYEQNEAAKKYANAVKTGRGAYSIGTFLSMVKDAGIHWVRRERDILQRTKLVKSVQNATVNNVAFTGVYWDIQDNGVIKINDRNLFNWLKHTYDIKLVKLSNYEDSESPSPYVLTTCSNNVLKPLSITDLRNFVGQHINKIKAPQERNLVKNAILTKIGKLITDAKVDMYFDIVDHKQQNDDKNTMYFPFQNGIVKVTTNEVALIQYKDVDGYFWQHEVNKHAFEPTNENSVFEDFVKRVSMNSDLTFNEKNEHWFQWIIGYLLHKRYRLEGHEKRMVVFTEHNIDSSVANGGTGKNLFLRACENLRSTVVVGGASYNSGGTFSFQNMNAATHIYGISDPKKFVLKDIYEYITGGVWVEKKNKQPYKAYPRIVGMFNHMPKGMDNSDERRMYVCVFSNFFNANNKGFEYYGQHIFDDFTLEQWNAFYSYMFKCCQKYLSSQTTPPVFTPDGFEDSKLLLNTSEHFLNIMKAFLSIGMLRYEDGEPIYDHVKNDYVVSIDTLYSQYDFHSKLSKDKQITKQTFTNYVMLYYQNKGYYISKQKKRYSCKPNNVVWCYVITPREDATSDENAKPM